LPFLTLPLNSPFKWFSTCGSSLSSTCSDQVSKIVYSRVSWGRHLCQFQICVFLVFTRFFQFIVSKNNSTLLLLIIFLNLIKAYNVRKLVIENYGKVLEMIAVHFLQYIIIAYSKCCKVFFVYGCNDQKGVEVT
jgi:hypothetical protein